MQDDLVVLPFDMDNATISETAIYNESGLKA